jgi:hypothetical protein
MINKLVFAAAISLTAVPQASAWNDILNSVWGSKGNDTGGIIPWTPENERASFDIATAQCARWNKFPVATSIHRVPGDYIAYTCVWDPPPAVAVVRHHRRIDVKIEK